MTMRDRRGSCGDGAGRLGGSGGTSRARGRMRSCICHSPALVPRPRDSAPPFVAEDSPCFGGGKSPDDLPLRAVGARGPGARAITEGLKRVDTIAAMTLAGPETGFDLGQVQPAT